MSFEEVRLPYKNEQYSLLNEYITLLFMHDMPYNLTIIQSIVRLLHGPRHYIYPESLAFR